LGAWAPPFTTLKWGTGRRGVTPAGRRERQSGKPSAFAKARAAAIDTPTQSVGTEARLVVIAVEVDEHLIQLGLIVKPPTADGIGHLVVDAAGRFEDALPGEASGVTVAQLDGFARSRRRS
jgi:hypothetical protein